MVTVYDRCGRLTFGSVVIDCTTAFFEVRCLGNVSHTLHVNSDYSMTRVIVKEVTTYDGRSTNNPYSFSQEDIQN